MLEIPVFYIFTFQLFSNIRFPSICDIKLLHNPIPGLVRSFTYAARRGDVSKVADMVQAGMPVDIDDEDGWTALFRAACYNRTDLVRYLLNNGANVNKQDRWGETALYSASRMNKTDVMTILLQHGAIKDIKDNYGFTPIDQARLPNNKEAVDLLEQY